MWVSRKRLDELEAEVAWLKGAVERLKADPEKRGVLFWDIYEPGVFSWGATWPIVKELRVPIKTLIEGLAEAIGVDIVPVDASPARVEFVPKTKKAKS